MSERIEDIWLNEIALKTVYAYTDYWDDELKCYRVSCPHCGEIYETQQGLAEHWWELSKNNALASKPCQKCGKAFVIIPTCSTSTAIKKREPMPDREQLDREFSEWLRAKYPRKSASC